MSNSKILLFFILAACLFAACEKTPAYDTATQLKIDDDSIAKFIIKDTIPAVKTAQGLYYVITKPGQDTAAATVNDSLVIHYVARLMLTQRVFDSTSTINIDSLATKFLLKDAIQGWELGIPLIRPGGHIRLLVPSPLAYQNRTIGTILTTSYLPPNSILDFDIQLIRVINPSYFKKPKTQ